MIPQRGRHYRKPALWKRILKWTALSLLVIILAAGIAGFIFVYHTLGKIGLDTEVIYEAKQQLDIPLPDEPENVLIMGTDSDPDGTNKRSDTIMLARVNPKGECLSILSMPRDLIVNIPGVGQDKINSAYAVGGAPLAIETVRDLTGQPVHHFVMIDYTGFEKAVDAMGGVYIDVDKRYFNDNSDALWGQEYEPIDIYPGYQKLSGKDALAFVRYRHTDSDFMRIARQQLFINDTKAQSMKWGNLTKIPELADVFASNTTSDIGRSDLLSLIKFTMALDRDRIFQVQAPVDELSGGYLSVSRDAFSQAIDDFNSPAFSKPEPAIPGAVAPEVPSATTKKTAIEVLNGNGEEGAASLAANLLMAKGFTSVAIGGNSSNSYLDNQIYFREGNQAAAEELAALLKPATVSPMPPELTTKAQVLVAVGSNFEGALTEKQPEAQAALTFEQDSETGRRSWQSASLQVPFKVQKPASFPAEFDYADFHIYEIQTDDGPRTALKVVAETETGDNWGIMETTFTNAPLLDNPTLEREISGRNYRFFYTGDKLRYLAWQDGDVVYWISNTLQKSLSEDTMVQLATSFKTV
ncbi:MAG: LCP family protein [Thermoleophilia bacterium]|nr:LCP family protein [Thermoleophilia bacterium]